MTPPILGAAAFIIAELTGTPYLDIALATVIPALLYFTSIYYMIDLEALKLSLMGHKAEDLPNVRSLIVRRGHLLIPILVLLYVMIVMKASVVKAAIFGIYATVLCTFLRRDTRITVNKAVAGIADGAKQAVGLISACATAGLIIGVLNMTGTGLKFAGAVIAFSGGSIPVALFLTMCASLVLGMGLPTAAAYLICAAVVAPALTGLGVPVLTANLFIFYFACLSAITPPVALAAFTASFLARSNPMSVAFTAVRLGFVAFIVPYMFVYAPSLLFQGSPLTIATTIVTALGRGDIHRIGIAGLFPWSAAPRRLSGAVLRGGHHADHPRLPDGRDRRRAGPLRIRCAALHGETRPADANLLKPTPG